MDLFEAIEKRHSVRKFLNEIPSESDVKRILDAARLAPSSHNHQMWRFVVVYNDEIKQKLKSAVVEKFEEIKKLPEAAEKQKQLDISKGYATFFTDAPVVIAVFMKPTTNTAEQVLKQSGVSSDELVRMRPRPDIQSIGASVQNLSLAASAMGYGSCWMSAPIVAYRKMEEILNFDSDYYLTALVALGRPDPDYKSKATKLSLEEIYTIIK